jgi:hypothetical protein
MNNRSPQWDHFIRRHRGRLSRIFMLLLVTVFLSFMSGSFFPWLFIPIFFIGLPILQDLFDTMIGGADDDEFEYEVEDIAGDEEFTREPTTKPAATKKPTSHSPIIQTHLDKARTYQEQIDAYIQATGDPRSRARSQDLSDQINEWTEAIEAMARRIDNYQQNEVISQDLESVPQSIKKLEVQLDNETNPAIHAELERTLANRKNQLATLQHLENTMKQAEIKMESTLASMGTIYSQLLASQSADHVADYSRLSEDVNEEVRTLQDHLEALEEVKLGRNY